MRKSPFLVKTLILVASNILTGTIMFLFSMLVTRKAGASAMGLFQLVMPLYAFFLFISGGGITVSMSKIAAEKKAAGNTAALEKTVRVMCLLELIWSFVVCLLILLLASLLSTQVLRDARTFWGIVAFCPAILFISVSSVFKGAFYGLQRIVAPALIDIVEKLFRLAMLVLLLRLTGTENPQQSAAVIVLSLSIGEFFSMMLLFLLYQREKKRLRKIYPVFAKTDNSVQLTVDVLKLSIPLALNGIIATAFSTLLTVMIPMRLQASGLSSEAALVSLGRLQGMAMMVIGYPTIVLSSYNILLIPALSEAQTTKKNLSTTHHIGNALRISSLTAFSTMALLLAVPHAIGNFFYHDSSLGTLLLLLAPGIPLAYLQISSFAILNGLGRQTDLLINSTILSIVDVVLLYVLLAIPSIGIKGYAMDFFLSSLLGLFLNYAVTRKHFDLSLNPLRIFLLPAVCSIPQYQLSVHLGKHIGNTAIVIVMSYLFCLALYLVLSSIPEHHNSRFHSSGKNSKLAG